MAASRWAFAHRELRADYPPPRLGEHSAEILRDVLRYDEPRINALFEADVVGCEDRGGGR
ncbi:MAG: hypothetical protein U5O39_11125 [Gammaproteobacteria bacterium]|nr:hypothetical protein [Gammaproteobacteria bacterium]